MGVPVGVAGAEPRERSEGRSERVRHFVLSYDVTQTITMMQDEKPSIYGGMGSG